MNSVARLLFLLMLLGLTPCLCFADDEGSEAKEEKPATAPESDEFEGSEAEEEKPAPIPEEVTAWLKKLEKLDLSDDQKDQLDSLVKATAGDYADSGPNDKQDIMDDFEYQVREYLLSAAQRDKLGLKSTGVVIEESPDDSEEYEGSEPEEKKEPAPVPKEVTACLKKLEKVDLSERQKKRLNRLVTSTSEDYADAGENSQADIIKDFKYQVTEYVLNAEQREKLGLGTEEEAKPETPKPVAALVKRLAALDLSEKQQRQLANLAAEISEEYARADNEEGRQTVLKEFRYRISEYILTDEQIEKIKQQRGKKDAPKKESAAKKE